MSQILYKRDNIGFLPATKVTYPFSLTLIIKAISPPFHCITYFLFCFRVQWVHVDPPVHQGLLGLRASRVRVENKERADHRDPWESEDLQEHQESAAKM